MPVMPCHSSPLKLSVIAFLLNPGGTLVQDVYRAVAAAEAGEPMRHRITRYAGGLTGRVGQREPRREPGRERGRVGAAGPVRGVQRVADHRERHVSGAV